MKIYWITLLSTITLILIAQTLFPFQYMTLVNQLFLYGLVIILIGAIIYVVESKFLALFFEGFKRLGWFLTGKPQSLVEEDDRLQQDERLQEWKSQFYRRIESITFGVGSGCTVVSIAMLFF